MENKLARKMIGVLFSLSVMSIDVHATPFLSLDARSAAMGGVGVASGVRGAPLNNPAILAYGVEFVDWYLSVPSYSVIRSDPEDLKKLLNTLQTTADALNASPTSVNAQDAEKALADISAVQKFDDTVATFFASIPSNILGAGVFLNSYEFRSMRTDVGAYDFSDPSNPIYDSVLEKRAVSVIEHGVSFAQVFTTDFRAFDTLAIGISPKIILWRAAGAREDITGSDTKVGFGGSQDGSAFTFDVGFLKELGRFYTAGLVVRNLAPVKIKYPKSVGGSEMLDTQVRAGIAYERRNRSFEVDVDLTRNSGVGVEQPSRMLNVGGEFVLTQYLVFRAGLRQNMMGNNDSLVTFGLGMGLDYMVDVAVAGGADELDVTAQFTIAF